MFGFPSVFLNNIIVGLSWDTKQNVNLNQRLFARETDKVRLV